MSPGGLFCSVQNLSTFDVKDYQLSNKFEVKDYQPSNKLHIDIIVCLIDLEVILNSTVPIAWYLYFCGDGSLDKNSCKN